MAEKHFFPSSTHDCDVIFKSVVGKGQSLANCITQVVFLIKDLAMWKKQMDSGIAVLSGCHPQVTYSLLV